MPPPELSPRPCDGPSGAARNRTFCELSPQIDDFRRISSPVVSSIPPAPGGVDLQHQRPAREGSGPRLPPPAPAPPRHRHRAARGRPVRAAAAGWLVAVGRASQRHHPVADHEAAQAAPRPQPRTLHQEVAYSPRRVDHPARSGGSVHHLMPRVPSLSLTTCGGDPATAGRRCRRGCRRTRWLCARRSPRALLAGGRRACRAPAPPPRPDWAWLPISSNWRTAQP